jgi:hypothetical protein
MSLSAFTPEAMSQFIQFAASQAGVSPMDYMRSLEKGIKPVPRETKSVEEFQNVVIKVEDDEEEPIKTTKTGKVRKPHCKPTTNANTLEVGAVEVDAEGRVHEVVQGQAFGKPCLKWKIVKEQKKVEKVEKEQDKVEKEPIRGLVDYSDSEDEAETTEVPAEMPVKTKRAYRSSKPSVKPSEVGETSESGGKVWIVAEAKVRGDGRRLLWKILKETENKGELDELDEQLAAEILANFNQHHDEQKAEWVPPENLPEAQWDTTKVPAEKPKPTRKSPEISANSETVQVGDVQVGIDGKNYKCVEMTRTSKKTGETTTFRRWQKMKA